MDWKKEIKAAKKHLKAKWRARKKLQRMMKRQELITRLSMAYLQIQSLFF